MEYRVLGPLEVDDGAHIVKLPAFKWRALLAILLCQANKFVSVDRIIDDLWGSQPPKAARNNLRSYISHLRRTLGDRGRIISRDAGYALLTSPGEVDAERFEVLAVQGISAQAQGDTAHALELLRRALMLWRGPAFGEFGTLGIVQGEARRLEERRLAVLEARINAELAMGDYDGNLVSELFRLTAAEPMRERFRAQLMRVLCQAGRQAEALEVFQDARRALVSELGIEPGPELQLLQTRILAGEATDAAPAKRPDTARRARRPTAQLPHKVLGFTGRESEMERLNSLISAGRHAASGDASIALITGPAGVGKTALSVQLAHQLADHYEDGQLFIDLRGYSGDESPLAPADALSHLLLGVGVDARQIPHELDDAAGLFRSLVAEKHVLLLLDNAASAEQVRPLLPGGRSCLTLVTSRNRLSGLVAREGAKRLFLGALTSQDAVALLEYYVGAQRVAAEPVAVRELARLCSYFPLALRIAAERVAIHPDFDLSYLVQMLASEDGRLDVLSTDEEATAVRTVFSWSYQALPANAARMFRFLSLHPGPDFGTRVAAALTGTSVNQARRLLDELTGAHLLEQTSHDRYRFHDLLRLYATERVGDDPEGDREQAVQRMLTWYLDQARAADRALNLRVPQLSCADDPVSAQPRSMSHSQAVSWFENERMNLVAAAHEGARRRHHAIAWQLPPALTKYFVLLAERPARDELIAIYEMGLKAARCASDSRGEAQLEINLGGLLWQAQRFQETAQHFNAALRLCRNNGDCYAEASTLVYLGTAYLSLGEPKRALSCCWRAIQLSRKTDNRSGEVWALTNLGTAFRDLGWLRAALNYHRESQRACQRDRDQYGEARALNELGETYRRMRLIDKAIECGWDSLEIRRRFGDRWGEADALNNMGQALYDDGRLREAVDVWRRALAISESFGTPHVARIRDRLSELEKP